MLGGLLGQYIFDKMIEQDHPTVDLTHCMNHKQRKKTCTICRDQCEEKVYKRSGKEADWRKCKDCNKCVSACPSRAIASSKDTMEKYQKLIEAEVDQIFISCEASSIKASLKVRCLASLPWELLAYLILQKKVVLDIGVCATCDKASCIEEIQMTLTQVMDVVGEAYFKEQLLLSQGDKKGKELVYSRRELMGMLLKGSKKSVSKLVPDFLGGDAHASGLWYRILLHNEMSYTEETFRWQIPDFTKACWGCGLCEKICPQGALEMIDDQDEIRYVRLHLWKCNGCGLCKALCTSQGISGMATVRIQNLMTATIAKIEMMRCHKCRRPIEKDTPPGLCIACEDQ